MYTWFLNVKRNRLVERTSFLFSFSTYILFCVELLTVKIVSNGQNVQEIGSLTNDKVLQMSLGKLLVYFSIVQCSLWQLE